MKPRILVVDDEEPIRIVIEKFLDGEDIAIDAADSLKDAIPLLESRKYDIVLIDKNMPGTDGLDEGGMELLRHIREKLIPCEVIIMTGFATLDTAIEAMRLGAFDYLLKPFSMQDLKIKINRLIEYRRFLDPAKTMEIYKTIRKKIFDLSINKASLADSELDNALTSLNESIDELFRFVKECEKFVLNHRESLAHIAGYAEQLKSQVPEQDASHHLIEEICRYSNNRL
jgi:DNA-binding response OmpR family regulator